MKEKRWGISNKLTLELVKRFKHPVTGLIGRVFVVYPKGYRGTNTKKAIRKGMRGFFTWPIRRHGIGLGRSSYISTYIKQINPSW